MAGPGFPRLALGLAWFCSALAVGILGWLAVSNRGDDYGLGWSMLGLATLALVALGAVISNKHRDATLTFSIVVSAAFVILGVASAGLSLLAQDSVVDDLLGVGGILVVGGLITGRLGQRSRSMSA